MAADSDSELDQLLSGLGAARRPVPPALMARILADAAAVQGRAQSVPVRFRPASGLQGHWYRIAAAVGGGRVLAGLGSVALFGVLLGFAQPAPLAALTDAVWGADLDISVDLWPDAGDLLAEG
ncbi:MAG: hypothetical protein V4516_05160 [Pseudomonadota bacterium]